MNHMAIFTARFAAAGLLTLALVVVSVATQAASALDKVTFGTDWVAEGEHGGYYQAKAEGIYEKYGLDVTIVPGGPQVNNPQLVAAGNVDVVLLTALQAIRFAKENVPLVGVAAMYQKNRRSSWPTSRKASNRWPISRAIRSWSPPSPATPSGRG